MSLQHRLRVWALCGASACCAPQLAHAFAIFTVGAGCPYATIQAALTAAYYSPGEDYVWIANNAIYSAQHITIADQDVDIEGGFTDCNDFDIGPNDTTTISGAGNDGGPVFEIGGNAHVYLGNLVIRGADRGTSSSASKGGGVSFVGAGSLSLGNTTVTSNTAYRGGGIYVEQSGGDATLTLLANTLILSNNAADGAGIALVGGRPGLADQHNVYFFADAADTLVAYNHASRAGGGLFVNYLAQAHLSSPGYGGLGVIFDNTAAQGGGIAVTMPTQASVAGPHVTLQGGDPAHPVRLQGNSASSAGGALYLSHGTGTLGNYPSLQVDASGFRMDDNIAPEGAAIFNETDPPAPNGSYHGITYLNLRNSTGIGYNSIDGNSALDGLGNPSGGSTLLLQTDGEFVLEGVSLRNNHGAHVIRTVSPASYDGRVTVDSVLLADNSVSSDLLSFEGNAYTGTIGFTGSTISHNTIGGGVVYSGYNLSLSLDILDQPGTIALGYAGPPSGISASLLLASDPATLPANSVMPGTPLFVDAAGGDYRLSKWSPGLDAGAGSAFSAYDLAGNPRVHALTSIPNGAGGGGQDIGAFEMQYVCAPDEVYCSGFGD